jgi:cytochrome c553
MDEPHLPRLRPHSKMLVAALGAALGGGFAAIAVAAAQAATVNGDRALGEYLSSECVTCHQLSGRVSGGVPAIVGIDAASFVALMESYRSKQRDNAVMQSIAARFNDEEIAALAVYFAGVKPRR